MKPRRKMDNEKSRKFWEALDRIAAEADSTHPKNRLGDPWTDSDRDISFGALPDSKECEECGKWFFGVKCECGWVSHCPFL